MSDNLWNLHSRWITHHGYAQDYVGMKEYFSSYFDKNIVVNSFHRQYLLFVAIGTLCFLLDISALTAMIEILGFKTLFAATISFLVSVGFNYFLNTKYIFLDGRFVRSKEALMFFVVSFAALVLTLALMNLFVEVFQWWYVTSKLLAALIISILTFTARKFIVFEK